MISESIQQELFDRPLVGAVSFRDLFDRYREYFYCLDDPSIQSSPESFWKESFDLLRPRVGESKALGVLSQRHNLYGAKSLLMCGEVGILVRCIDKLCRIENMVSKGLEDTEDPIEDAWLDLFNYAILGYVLIKGGLT